MQDEVGARPQGRLEAQGRLGAGLRVGDVGVGEGAAGAHRQAQAVAQGDRRLDEQPSTRERP